MRKSGEVKYVFVTGGVLSGVGKGISAASIGNILKSRGLSVNIQKCDPYLNVDAGTLNPGEHGECFVTVDGAETDLDLGHYERFMDIELKQSSSLMSGRVLLQVIQDERAGKYLGKTVQIIPHVTTAIADHIMKTAEGFDVHIIEIGGTVGDYEGLSFVEAIRELAMRVGRQNCVFVHVVYLPYLGASGELKTKPAQNAVRDLRGLGIVPDVLVARSEIEPSEDVIQKLSLFSGVESDAIVLLPNAKTIYEVPLTLEERGIGSVITNKLQLKVGKPNLKKWADLVSRATDVDAPVVRVGVVAKYLNNQDTYMSVFEALKAAAWNENYQVQIEWIDAEKVTSSNVANLLKNVDGIVVPGGFGKRGLEGKIVAAQYALREKVPYLGLCLGLQMGVIAAARNAGLTDANTIELNTETKDPVIHIMEDQKYIDKMGGTMRLGNYPCVLAKGSLARRVYGKDLVQERHRHRYECNNAYRDTYEKWGIRASGVSPDGHLVEMIEGVDHPFFLATQAHPELASRPNRPHPMFAGFISTLISRDK
ncbi:MAG TPA: CTP synthase [Candidatus Saccharibacteria bacterium]|nr:CTP synthase [Candidatus Saccharibacteria bacterium]HMT55446.1 CTP synthase [Candidatus Saccharibacteria bacterium]